jgi:hypothetical protein
MLLGVVALLGPLSALAAEPPAAAAQPAQPLTPSKLATDATPEPAPKHYAVTVGEPASPVECCPPCGPRGRTWVNFEWLYWATTGQSLPPLVAVSLPGTPRTAAGIVGIPTTEIVAGSSRVNDDVRNGFRVTGGFWLNDGQTFGIEGDFFFLGRSREGFGLSSVGSPVVARPFFNALTGQPDAQLVAFPGLAGTVTVDATSDVIGGGVNALHNLCCTPCGRVDFLLGYRYFSLTDEVAITEDLTAVDGSSGAVPGTRFQILDRFRTENDFHGGVLGLAGEKRRGKYFFAARASVALGTNYQTTRIDGSTTIAPPGGPGTTFPGGLLALPSNIGTYDRSEFAVLPEAMLRGGVQCTEHLRTYIGFNFLYLSNVVRAGDQIDLRVNPNQLPPATAAGGPPVPQFPNKTTDFFIYGVNIGAELRF